MQELTELQPELVQTSEDGKTEDSQQLSRVRAKSLAAIDALMLTDAPLLFPPGQLALAALRSGMKAVSDSQPLDKLVGKGRLAISDWQSLYQGFPDLNFQSFQRFLL